MSRRAALGLQLAVVAPDTIAVTGVVLVGFVVAHMLVNLRTFLGTEAIDTYAAFPRACQDRSGRSLRLASARGGRISCMSTTLQGMLDVRKRSGRCRASRV